MVMASQTDKLPPDLGAGGHCPRNERKIPKIRVKMTPSSSEEDVAGQVCDRKPKIFISKRTHNVMIQLPNGDLFEGKLIN